MTKFRSGQIVRGSHHSFSFPHMPRDQGVHQYRKGYVVLDHRQNNQIVIAAPLDNLRIIEHILAKNLMPSGKSDWTVMYGVRPGNKLSVRYAHYGAIDDTGQIRLIYAGCHRFTSGEEALGPSGWHPNYRRSSSHGSKRNDIALTKWSRKFVHEVMEEADRISASLKTRKSKETEKMKGDFIKEIEKELKLLKTANSYREIEVTLSDVSGIIESYSDLFRECGE